MSLGITVGNALRIHHPGMARRGKQTGGLDDCRVLAMLIVSVSVLGYGNSLRQ